MTTLKNIKNSINIMTIAALSGLFSLGLIPMTASAAGPGLTFTQAFTYGSANVQVTALQNLLSTIGYFHAIPDGKFLAGTQAALKLFQNENGIRPDGYFGADTMAAANARVQTLRNAQYVADLRQHSNLAFATATASTPSSRVAITSVSKPTLTGSIFDAIFSISPTHTITWETANYPTNAGVTINLLRQTSTDPISYSLVRQLAHNASNTGTFTWTPQTGETGNDLSIEVVCSASTGTALTTGCQNTAAPIKVQ